MNAHRLPLLFCLAALAGCTGLLSVKSQPFTTYAPAYHAPPEAEKGLPVDWQLVVETPLSSDILNTTRIVVMPQPGVIEVYPNSRWSDPAPTLLRNLVVQGFEQSGRIVGVGSATSGITGDFALAIDLRAFQSEVRQGTPHAVVQFQARLLDYRNSRVVASRHFAADAPFPSADTTAAFNAFESVVGTAVSELVAWTLKEGEQARKSR